MGKVWLSMKFSAYKWCAHYYLMVFFPLTQPAECLAFSEECFPSLINLDLCTTATTCNIFMVCRSLSSFIIVAEECIASGIAASTARPFSPPIAFRTTARQRPGKLERTQMLEGQCHRCMRWVPVQGVKDTEAKVLHLSLSLDRPLNVWRAGVR
jgi:hypothetical protein